MYLQNHHINELTTLLCERAFDKQVALQQQLRVEQTSVKDVLIHRLTLKLQHLGNGRERMISYAMQL